MLTQSIARGLTRGLFYQRLETEDTITLTFFAVPVFYWLLLLFVFLAILSHGILASVGFLIYMVLLLIYQVLNWPASKELLEAMDNQGVYCRGSPFSFTRPLNWVIDKSR